MTITWSECLASVAEILLCKFSKIRPKIMVHALFCEPELLIHNDSAFVWIIRKLELIPGKGTDFSLHHSI
jgi:hypothetical protein